MLDYRLQFALFLISALGFLLPTARAWSPSSHAEASAPQSLSVPSAVSAIDENLFNEILIEVQGLYAEEVEGHGATLSFTGAWGSKQVNAVATRGWMFGDIWQVTVFGGLARAPAMTADGMRLAMCHEIGHHLGGLPKTTILKWAASEGQADYFAALKCIRRVFRQNDQPLDLDVPPLVIERCRNVYRDALDIKICARTAMAGLSFVHVFSDLHHQPMPSFTTPDLTETPATRFDGYPGLQCRLDTFIAGSLCPRATQDKVSETDPGAGTCESGEGEVLGHRPRCWYHPEATVTKLH